MIKKMISLSLLTTISVCAVAIAKDYDTPDVHFKAHEAPTKEMHPSQFGENYKVENAVNTDRQIASEKNDKDNKDGAAEQATEAPQPWLFKTQPAGSY